MATYRGRELVHPASLAEWRAWLEANHSTADGAWLASWRRETGRSNPSYPELVEEALCFGWIDGLINRIDDERNAILVTPRRAGSGWSRSNKERIERLMAEGRMADAGLAVIERAKADGSWTLLDASEALEVPRQLSAALDGNRVARRNWDAFPPGVRKAHIAWVTTAKRAETRERRVAQIVSEAAENRRANY